MKHGPGSVGSNWSRHLATIGLVGSLVAALCCLGVPAVLAIVSAVGLGFLISDETLFPLLVVFAGVLLLGLGLGVRRHRSPWALVVGLVSAIVIVFFLFVHYSRVFAILGVAGLVASSLLNIYLRQQQIRTRK